ncbi:hypothetical protein SAMN05216480_101479 [Pustulibacterium marinum]|uniref:Uncharacterized protein n=2 Tax=Pustulibacterium marinum TaxID=1224947 RepID=A0A1I7EZV8_9FLAO|nr:hypothetical protein SAMN05216480_101479 [Pustulibacterium marinum]
MHSNSPFDYIYKKIAMKNNLNTEVVLQEIRFLLRTSCQEESLQQKHFESLHCAILKKHFKAGDVKIDHRNKVIHLSMNVDSSANFFGQKSYVDVEMKFKNIYDFLESCLETSDQNIVFYRNILKFYNQRAV